MNSSTAQPRWCKPRAPQPGDLLGGKGFPVPQGGFVALLITALLRPLTDRLSRRLPRGATVAVALIQAIIAWTAFAGYARGIVVVAGTNAIFVCIVLLVLRVPLA